MQTSLKRAPHSALPCTSRSEGTLSASHIKHATLMLIRLNSHSHSLMHQDAMLLYKMRCGWL